MTAVALYVEASLLPGYGTEGAPVRVPDGEGGIRGHAATIVVPLPLRSDCPRCAVLMAQGGPLAGILAEDDYCLAPYTHAQMTGDHED